MAAITIASLILWLLVVIRQRDNARAKAKRQTSIAAAYLADKLVAERQAEKLHRNMRQMNDINAYIHRRMFEANVSEN